MAVSDKYTAEEFLNDDSFPERCELINGEAVPALTFPNVFHQELIADLTADIKIYIRKSKGNCRALPAPADVKLSDDTVVQPDIYVTCHPEKFDRNKFNGAPDWVIEVVSPFNAINDYFTKLFLYRNSGVREYWIVDPRRSTVIVYIWDGEHEENNIYSFEDDIPVYIYKDNAEQLVLKIAGH